MKLISGIDTSTILHNLPDLRTDKTLFMKPCFFLLLAALSLPGRAQKFSAADLRMLNTYSTGFFTNDLQVKTDSVHFIQSVLKVQPVWVKRKDGVWLFAEKTDSIHHYQVWHFYLQDDTTVLLQFLDFKMNKQALQLSQDIKQQSNLSLNNLITRQGCGLYLKKNKTVYEAGSAGKDCLADKPGVEYLTYNIAFTKNAITWQENDFNKDDQPSTAGAYKFIKQDKLPK